VRDGRGRWEEVEKEGKKRRLWRGHGKGIRNGESEGGEDKGMRRMGGRDRKGKERWEEEMEGDGKRWEEVGGGLPSLAGAVGGGTPRALPKGGVGDGCSAGAIPGRGTARPPGGELIRFGVEGAEKEMGEEMEGDGGRWREGKRTGVSRRSTLALRKR